MKGVFHGVMTPTGPIGLRVVTFRWSGVGSDWPSRAPGARSAKKRKFSAPRSAALDMKRQRLPGVPAFAQGDLLGPRLDPVGDAVQDAPCACRPASLPRPERPPWPPWPRASMSAAVPRATRAIRLSSTGERVSNAPTPGTSCAVDQVQDAARPKPRQMAVQLGQMGGKVGHSVLSRQVAADRAGLGAKGGVDVAHLQATA